MTDRKLNDARECVDKLNQSNCVSYLLIALTEDEGVIYSHYWYHDMLQVPGILDTAMEDLAYSKTFRGLRDDE
jgi:predicted SAM-dependent methyltransferase